MLSSSASLLPTEPGFRLQCVQWCEAEPQPGPASICQFAKQRVLGRAGWVFSMVGSNEETISRTLRAVASGNRQAAPDLLPLIYQELRTLARARLRKLPFGQSLQPTSLVHEAYLRVVKHGDPGWDCRGHFFAAAAEAMRQILVEHARRKASLKRGGDRKRAALHDSDLRIELPSENILAVHETLERLEALDPEKAKMVKLRYFAGLSPDETATTLDMSRDQFRRRWKFIRAWFRRELGEEETRSSGL